MDWVQNWITTTASWNRFRKQIADGAARPMGKSNQLLGGGAGFCTNKLKQSGSGFKYTISYGDFHFRDPEGKAAADVPGIMAMITS